MKKLNLVFAVLFMVTSPFFGLRHFLLKSAWKGGTPLAHAEKIGNLKSWTLINGYAALLSLTIGLLLMIWSTKERRCHANME